MYCACHDICNPAATKYRKIHDFSSDAGTTCCACYDICNTAAMKYYKKTSLQLRRRDDVLRLPRHLQPRSDEVV